MSFKKKDEVAEEPKKTQTIQERMKEVYDWHINRFLKEMEAGKVDIDIERKLSLYSFGDAVVGCTPNEKVEISYAKKQVLGVLEVNQLAEKACDIVKDKIIKFAESKGYTCINKDDYMGDFRFSAKKRKDLSALEKEITEWQP